jgi:transcriptional regulator with XRE-family HTH domain
MTQFRDAFAANLRRLIAEEDSIAHVCRELSINRQQFNRYLSAETLPSDANLAKIATFFKVSENSLFQVYARPAPLVPPIGFDRYFVKLDEAFGPEQKLVLDGRYYFYLPSPGEGRHCLKGIFTVKREATNVRVNGLVRAMNPATPTRFQTISRFSGLMRENHGTITFLTSYDDDPGDIMFVNLVAMVNGPRHFFSGLCTSSRSGLVMARRMAVERLPDSERTLTLARHCGVFDLDSPSIDPWVRAALTADDGSWASIMSPKSPSAVENSFIGERTY